MSELVNRRNFIEASRTLVISSAPTEDMVLNVCTALAAVLTDLQGEPVFVIPLSRDEAQMLADQAATQTKEPPHA